MKRLAIPLYLGFLCYVLSQSLLGPSSPRSMDRLESERARIQANLDELKRINSGFSRRIEALRGDEETIALEARALGFARAGETVVRVDREEPRRRYVVAGKILGFKEGALPGQALPLPIAAFAFALGLFAVSALAKDAKRDGQ